MFFIFGKYSDALLAINWIKSYPKDSWKNIEWHLELLCFLSHYECQNLGILDSQYHKVKRAAAKIRLEYPDLVTKALGRVYRYPFQNFKQEWVSFRSEIDQILENPHERLFADAFNFSMWASAHIEKKSLPVLYFEKPFPRQNKSSISLAGS